MKARIVDIEPDSELDHAIEGAGDVPVILVRNGVRYKVFREDLAEPSSHEPSTAHDRERLVAGMRAAAGSWKDVDTDKLIADIYRWREEGSRPPDRP